VTARGARPDVHLNLPPAGVRIAFALFAAGLVAFAVHAFADIGGSGPGPHPAFDHVLYLALMTGAAVICLARVVLIARQRPAWLLIGLGLLAWALGDVYWVIELSALEAPPFPSPADAGYIAAYPLFVAGLLLLLAPRIRGLRASAWLDAALGAVAVTAIGATLLLGSIVDAMQGWTVAEQVATLAYPIGDILELGFIAAIVVLTGLRPGRALTIVIAALALSAGADAVFSYQDAVGTYAEGGFVDVMWPLAAGLIALAAWNPSEMRPAPRPRGWRSLALPLTFVLSAFGIVAWGGVSGQGAIEALIASLMLFLLVARTTVSFVENHRLLERVQTDSLTGLSNRGKLLVDLDDALDRGPDAPKVLIYFDLDGFKLYNDTYGHPAGDALLARLGARLRAALPRDGGAYRIGGDEFCVLLGGNLETTAAAVAAARAALCEQGSGFQIGSSYGVAELPREASTPETILQLADRRLYAHKGSSRTSAAMQAQAVLLRAMAERAPDLAPHGSSVATLAAHTGERLDLGPSELVSLTRAAELHDIGKVAIPDAVLGKPGPLTEDEWAFMRQHTVLGERILLAAPALAEAASIVRSSHERYDGAGYPDGLAGGEIPLAARIIFACDAYDAMTSDRPYAAALSPADARAALRRNAGSQFDPAVVEALCSALGADVARRSAADLHAASANGNGAAPERRRDPHRMPAYGGSIDRRG